jgi:hypothetical protein
MPQIELHELAQSSVTKLVRAPQQDLPRALAGAIAQLAHRYEQLRPTRWQLALRTLDRTGAEVAVCMLVREPAASGRDVELAEVPCGRYLTLDSSLDPSELASVLPRMRDWLGEHRESATGPCFLELIQGRLTVRQRIIGGVTRGAIVLTTEAALRTLVDALLRAPSLERNAPSEAV